MKQIIDLRSDTVTRPSAAMLEAMMRADVGDDVYGEDPTVSALESKLAALLGKEAALYVPSGTMANQLAIAVHTRPGDSIVAEVGAHCFYYEAGGAAALSGVQFDLLPLDQEMADTAIEEAVHPEGIHNATTSLLVVENTHNRGAGRVLFPETLQRITKKAKSLGLATHCDGARLWNAAVAAQAPEKVLAEGFDTLAVCFSKGLGAPVGSALVGSRSLIERARKLRKRWGGGMRQAGYIAAAAIYALDNNRARLADDHANAGLIASALREAGAEVRFPEPSTNMVYFKLGKGDADRQLKELHQECGLLLNTVGGGWLRAVTHLDLSRAAAEQAADLLTRFVKRQG